MAPKAPKPLPNVPTLRRSARLIQKKAKPPATAVASGRVEKKNVKWSKTKNEEFPHRFPPNCKKRKHPTALTSKPILKKVSSYPFRPSGATARSQSYAPKVTEEEQQRAAKMAKSGSSSDSENDRARQRNSRVFGTRRLVYTLQESVVGSPYKARFTRIPYKKDVVKLGKKGREMKSQVVVYFADDMDIERHFGDGLPEGLDVIFHPDAEVGEDEGGDDSDAESDGEETV